MGNEHLHEALIAKHLAIEDIVHATGVDPRTVQRWLKGRVPHPRHRSKIAQLLDEREDSLWQLQDYSIPSAPARTTEIVAAYAHRSDVPPSAWWKLFLQAKKNIDLLGIALLFLPEQHPDLVDLLKEKAAASCAIRIALADPLSSTVLMRDAEEQPGTLPARIKTTLYHFRDILYQDDIQVRFHSTILYCSYARMDNDMFVMPQLYKLHGSKAPLLHLRYSGTPGLFTNFAEHFETVWTTTRPIEESRL